jgi:putative copper resistance protein D
MILTDLLVIASRFVEYGGAMILFGSSLFLLYSHPFASPISPPGPVRVKYLLTCGALGLFIATALGFLAQTAGLAGSFGAAIAPDTLKAVLGMNFGPSSLIRLLAAVIAIFASLWARPGRGLWLLCCLCGTVACASFSWMGHGAATEGPGRLLHLAGDILHSLAAAGWIGALAVFCVLLVTPSQSTPEQKALCASLAQFSGAGTALVIIIVGSGLINSFFLVGWNPTAIAHSRYGQVLAAKLILFAIMLALAAANRFRHTPSLALALDNRLSAATDVARLRKSIFSETVTAVGVLALVSWLGTLAPVTAQ